MADPIDRAELAALDAWAVREHVALNQRQAEIQRAVTALRVARKARDESSLHTYDDADAQVQSAARTLAALRNPNTRNENG